MTAPSLDHVKLEFAGLLNDFAGAHSFAFQGLMLVRERTPELLANANPDNHLLIGHGPPGEEGTLGYQRWRIGSLPEQLAEDGPVAEYLGQQWVVGVFTHWEDRYRQQYADALGCTKNQVVEPLLGDLRLMRHDIVHHRGIASTGNAASCAVLTWFAPGDAILVGTEQVADFMIRAGLAFKP